MRAWTLAFSSGVILCGFAPRVSAFPFILFLFCAGCLLQPLPRLRVAGAGLLGCGCLLLYAHNSVAALWPAELEGVDVFAHGIVWSLPQQAERSRRFEFHVERFCVADAACAAGAAPRVDQKVLINLYEPLAVAPGQRWQLRLRLQRPHGFANPGGFDYEAWLMQNRIRATGYVRADRANRLLAAQTGQRVFTQWRYALIRRLAAVEGLRYPHLVRALTLGDHYGIAEQEWNLFGATGTNHLIVISGMHIALIALVLYQLGWWLATRSTRLLLVCPAPQVAAAFALFGAWCYSGLAGFSLPVQRALVMAAVLFAGRLLRRQTSSSHALCLALALILLLDPLAPQNAGFWLSYCAVAVLVLALGKARESTLNEDEAPTPLRRLYRVLVLEWRTQWRVFLGLLPIMLLFFQQLSPLAPLINMPAIPWIGLLVVPLALCAMSLLALWPFAAKLLLQLTDLLLHGYMATLRSWVELTPFDLVTLPSLPAPALAVLCVLVIAALCARTATVRWGAALTLPAIFLCWPRPELAEGVARIAVLDVGQGLAVVVSTRRHQLLYDTGPYYSARFDAGSDVVVPYLRRRNIHRLDTVVVSHADSDHAGGLAGVARAYPGARYLGSAPERFPAGLDAQRCRAGQRWHWDGVDFALLHPDRDGYGSNDGSCVLRIASGNHSLLLTGDIERAGELQLLPELGRTSVLVAPHHGSRSSSAPAFVAATAPAVVIFPSGYRNRFNHPHPEVRARYAAAGSREYLTAASGALEFELAEEAVGPVREWRRERPRFWASRP